MRVYLLQDVERVGMAGEIITVSDGFAHNFLLPRKLALEVTEANKKMFERRARVIEKRSEVMESRTSMLAERIKSTTLLLKRKVHDGDRLYGAIAAGDIVELLAEKGIAVSKNQVMVDKAIKKTGVYSITIKLSSRLQPAVTLKVVSEAP
jgi:large subunit ribosomal protein L9